MLKSLKFIKMSDEKDDLRSIKVYKFDNTKESWHEFVLKSRVIADGTKTPPPPSLLKRDH